jgi:hypothetical protein
MNVAALAERGCRRAPLFPSVPKRSHAVSDRAYPGRYVSLTLSRYIW